ncbi:hypothetical protein [Haloarcula rubra]|nr:hypothetical protein [Halomicroarcula rubra]
MYSDSNSDRSNEDDHKKSGSTDTHHVDVPRSPYVRRYMGLDAVEARSDDIPSDWDVAGQESATLSESDCYGWFDGQPMVPSRSDERRAEINVIGSAPDALSEPDSVPPSSALILKGADKLTDPTGDQLVGVSSGLDESHPSGSADTTTPTDQKLVPWNQLDFRTLRLRSRDYIPKAEQTPASALGIEPTDLEVSLPDGSTLPLGAIVPNPEQYSRSSIPGIERRLALDYELKKVTNGIDQHGQTSGVAAVLDAHTDALAIYREEQNSIFPQRRSERFEQSIQEQSDPLRELEASYPESVPKVLAEAKRFYTDFRHAHEIRTKTPVQMASVLARCVLDGRDLSSAVLTQSELEKHDPRNVLKIGNIQYTNTYSTRGYVSTQGRVKRVYYPDNPKIKFGFILEDDSGFAYVAVWKPSERVITRSTSDPDDADGEVIVSESIFVEPNEGDLVRLTDFRKDEFNDQPSLNSRWDSDIRILEKATRTSTRRPPTQHRPTPPTHKRSNAASEDESTGESANAMARYTGDTSTEWPDSDWLNWIMSAEIATVTRQSTIAQPTAGETVSNGADEQTDTHLSSDSAWDSSACWVCQQQSGSMSYDSDVRAFYHLICLDRAGVDSCSEYEELRSQEVHH